MKKKDLINSLISKCPFVDEYPGCPLRLISALNKIKKYNEIAKLLKDEQMQAMLSAHFDCPYLIQNHPRRSIQFGEWWD